MTREEYLQRVRTLSGIEVPNEEQEAVIAELTAVFDGYADVATLHEELQQTKDSLSKAQADYTALQERYKKHFWSGEDYDDKPKGKKPEKKQTNYTSFSFEDLLE